MRHTCLWRHMPQGGESSGSFLGSIQSGAKSHLVMGVGVAAAKLPEPSIFALTVHAMLLLLCKLLLPECIAPCQVCMKSVHALCSGKLESQLMCWLLCVGTIRSMVPREKCLY